MKNLIFTLLILTCFSACKNKPEAETISNIEHIDLQEIKDRGKLIVATDYNSVNYFIYKGTPMGYQLELINKLCDRLGVELELKINNDIDKCIEDLNNGEIDLIARNLTVTNDKRQQIAFTEPHTYAQQVLVQRKFSRDSVNSTTPFIRNQIKLGGKTVYVTKGSAQVTRLEHLSDEIGDSINIVEIDDYESEQLIGLVADGEIDYTVSSDILANVNKAYYPNIDTKTPISFTQKLAWGVRTSSPDLQEFINNWLKEFKKTIYYTLIYNRYYKNVRSRHIANTDYNTVKGGALSPYDDIFKAETAELIDWDWRLVCSLAYQESRFDPDIVSWAGAKGLMQLMPSTAQLFKVENLFSPKENIRGGISLIKWLDERFALRVEDPNERINFVLAAYNVGIGHVLDAIRLAEKHGKDPQKWKDNVEFFLLNKSKPEYYNDPVVQFGYCRGQEPYMYVHEILNRYEHYKNAID